MNKEIQTRNRYTKEINILINRLTILQQQEKSYADLSDKIKSKKITLNRLDEDIDDIIYQKDIKDSELSELGVLLNTLSSDKRKIDKELLDIRLKINKDKESYAMEKIVYENHLDKISKTINKYSIRKDLLKSDLEKKEIEYEQCVNKIKTDKWDLFDKVLNNKKILQEQEQENKKLEIKNKKLKSKHKELDKEYQKLLENYIITQ